MNHNYPKSEQELQDLLGNAFDSHQNGDNRTAEQLYRQLITYLPDFWQLYYNLGLLLFDELRYDEALEVYQKGACLPGAINDLLFNYAICQKKLGRFEDAIATYDQALLSEPDDIESHYNQAGCFMALQRFEDASLSYQRVLARDPNHLSALNNQAGLCQRLGKKSQAIILYREILKLSPGHHSADHMLAALTGQPRQSAPEGYIRDVFDQFSDHYEESLVNNLHYRVPERLFSIVMGEIHRSSFTSLLDLGCGTGLLGDYFHNVVDTMHGVDISSKMIEKAELKGTYDQLFNEEVCTFLDLCEPSSYDLLIAADVFTYIGELDDVFAKAKRGSTDNVLFCFSVEDYRNGPDALCLRESGRFAHSCRYIAMTADKNGWDICFSKQMNLRREKDTWIPGCVYLLRKRVT
jgi:predicted TPR repeat methyltransferase